VKPEQTGSCDPETRIVKRYDPADVEERFNTALDELISAATALADNDARSWDGIEEELERRIAHQKEWGQSVEAPAAHAQDDPARPRQAQGGAMPTHPELLAKPRRPFTGYDRERATFERIKPDLPATAEGKFVVIVGDEVVGPVDSHAEAELAGYAAFGLGPLYVKEVLAVEPVAGVTRLVAS
jgi:hypothetical protein